MRCSCSFPNRSPRPPPPPPRLSRFTVEGETAGAALRKLRDAVTDRGVNEIAALAVTASAEPGQGTAGLRVLGHCASQLPRFECRFEVSLQVEFGGLQGGVDIGLTGGIADWRAVEETVWTLADLGSAAGGTLTMRLTPPSPIAVGGSDWKQFRTVVSHNDPGALRIEAEPADSAASGGGEQ